MVPQQVMYLSPRSAVNQSNKNKDEDAKKKADNNHSTVSCILLLLLLETKANRRQNKIFLPRFSKTRTKRKSRPKMTKGIKWLASNALLKLFIEVAAKMIKLLLLSTKRGFFWSNRRLVSVPKSVVYVFMHVWENIYWYKQSQRRAMKCLEQTKTRIVLLLVNIKDLVFFEWKRE